MRFETTNEPISNYRLLNEDREIDLNAPYQRGNAWSPEQKSKLVSSILSRYCISNILYRNVKSPNKTVREIIDGKQRLNAIFSYRKNEFKLIKCADVVIEDVSYQIENKLFSELDEPVRRHFDSYKVATTEFVEATEDEIREQFRRTNNGSVMHPAEKRFALLGCISDVTDTIINNDFIKKLFTKSKRDKIVFAERMIYLHLNGGVITHSLKQSVFEEMHRLHRMDKKEDIIKDVLGVFDNFNKIFSTASEQTVRTIKQFGHSVGLFLLVREYGDFFVDPKQFLNWYVDYCAQEDTLRVLAGLDLKKNATGDKIKTVKELKIMKDFFEKCLEEGQISLKDTQRFFNDSQKKELLKKANGVCVGCGASLPETTYHADHITPWSKGGETDVENGQILCVDCNLKKSNKQLELIPV